MLRPGGSLILLGWTSQGLLPGYPLLEARLNATCSGYLPYLKGKDPGLKFPAGDGRAARGGPGRGQGADFRGRRTGPAQRRGTPRPDLAVRDAVGAARSRRQSEEDWKEYQRLCMPGSPDFILDLPDYYAFFTYSMFQGKVPLG